MIPDLKPAVWRVSNSVAPVTQPLSSHVSYDELPYDGGCVQGSHPSRMRAVGRLFGLEGPDPSTARVLELGCAGGSNLLPLAFMLPEAQFTGIDLSSRQVELARDRAAQLGVTNVDLHAMGIEDATEALPGPFDYIICHGVYSWVPERVRQAILRIIREHLSPNGIAFVSYNALPGWHLRATVRDMMMYHSRYFSSVEERAEQARALVDFVTDGGTQLSSAIPGLTTANQANSATRDIIVRFPDYYVVHEFLENDNKAFYLHEFVDDIEAQGLQYLGDSDISSMVATNLPTDIAQTLERISLTAVTLEQYRDFLVNRAFKHSLVCHSEVKLERAIEPSIARRLRFRLAHPLAVSQELPESAPGADGRLIPLGNELSQGVVAVLRDAYPREVCWNDLVIRVRGQADAPSDDDELERLVLNLLAHNIVEAIDGPLAPEAPGRGNPTAWPPARVFAQDMSVVPTRYLQAQALSPPSSAMIQLLDGSRTEDEVLQDAISAVVAPGVTYELTDGTVSGPDLPQELVGEIASALLNELRRHGVLED